MLKAGLIGIGFMGRGHLDQYIRLASEGADVTLAAICDVDDKKFRGEFAPGNIDVGGAEYDFTPYRLYSDYNVMFEKEDLDYADIALPTYLHAEASCAAMRAGLHVLCEKPMALDPEQCAQMIRVSRETGKTLMVGQCLRFWPAYEHLKACVEDERYGAPVCGYFWRGGDTPAWSFENWLRDEGRSGGCILDQHVHDVDTIHWLFGPPEAVSTLGRNVLPGAGLDAVSTHYHYPNFIVNAQDDWSMNGEVPFTMTFRVSFERGSLHFDGSGLRVAPVGADAFDADLSPDTGYYREIKYFTNALQTGSPIDRVTPESTRATICIATAERESAKKNGEWTKIVI